MVALASTRALSHPTNSIRFSTCVCYNSKAQATKHGLTAIVLSIVVYLVWSVFKNAVNLIQSCSYCPTRQHIYITITALSILSWTLRNFGAYIFEETRSAKNHRHEHLYTRIRNIWYDLAAFDHPGGPIALNLAKDRDATALFESHHLLVSHQKTQLILQKYKVCDKVAATLTTLDVRDDGAHYIWKEFENDAFVSDVKKVLLSHFAPIAQRRGITLYQATKATPQRWLWIILLMTAFAMTVPFFVSGHWWALLLTPQIAWVTIANYWHDCLHFSLSSNWRVNAILPYLFPWLSSPWMWYHQHVIGHHAYTNVGHKDPDIAHAPQLMREHTSIKWRKYHESQSRWTQAALVWFVAVGLGLQIVNDLRANLKLSYNNAVSYSKLSIPRMAAHLLGRAVYVGSVFVWPYFVFPHWKATIWAFVPIASFSWSFMLNSQINHLTEACSHASSSNFLKHQVVTAQNFGVNSLLCTLFSGGLNYQIEHHLFPFVNHCHLPHLAPKVKELCKKHGLTYNEASGYRQAFEQHMKHTYHMSKNPMN